jgi:hypothetical protein
VLLRLLPLPLLLLLLLVLLPSGVGPSLSLVNSRQQGTYK